MPAPTDRPTPANRAAPVSRRQLGQQIEQAAARWLATQGLTLVASNQHAKGGEIDLVMRDGEHLVFVEVRHRQRSDYGSPLETITPAKQRRIIKAARFYLHAQQLSCPCRFDVVGVTGSPPLLEFDWIRSAFDAY
ncbi:YraN family protein [Salinicola sp. LHM]|uniref:YraN family protein n=1 Tax=Salinicola sp. LHM TaxID=3065298 RepID=UPI002ACD2B3D|nr:YraN family protein [Salinicola sp. LHM]MEC8916085.1 YraN family protein [Pseudomonadota bacterium]MED5501725.1 YraN family protein [Pseudomonadota bacterium]WQH34577.1 YraN family protein [Salinicola sp. LHM]